MNIMDSVRHKLVDLQVEIERRKSQLPMDFNGRDYAPVFDIIALGAKLHHCAVLLNHGHYAAAEVLLDMDKKLSTMDGERKNVC